ncbi:hypothetical protein Patl1_12798 [Pistacia atlantica]|uniref:Uncharacterized protein n=1 Tax=Pistacia atlantica TaxID=434234 RepID=A0ACC1AWH7_9ROSI|nr:hypothetical protein Patl1_12798 [Pistacia atlantica]
MRAPKAATDSNEKKARVREISYGSLPKKIVEVEGGHLRQEGDGRELKMEGVRAETRLSWAVSSSLAFSYIILFTIISDSMLYSMPQALTVLDPRRDQTTFGRSLESEPGARANIPHSDLRYNDANPERHEVIMIFVDGVGTGAGLVPRDVINFSRVICGRNEDGILVVWMLGRRGFRGPRISSGTGGAFICCRAARTTRRPCH